MSVNSSVTVALADYTNRPFLPISLGALGASQGGCPGRGNVDAGRVELSYRAPNEMTLQGLSRVETERQTTGVPDPEGGANVRPASSTVTHARRSPGRWSQIRSDDGVGSLAPGRETSGGRDAEGFSASHSTPIPRDSHRLPRGSEQWRSAAACYSRTKHRAALSRLSTPPANSLTCSVW
jgi:hypothetical protein